MFYSYVNSPRVAKVRSLAFPPAMEADYGGDDVMFNTTQEARSLCTHLLRIRKEIQNIRKENKSSINIADYVLLI